MSERIVVGTRKGTFVVEKVGGSFKPRLRTGVKADKKRR
jgi:hypothetical protein